jgi:predicted nuclease of predicted toxin-antitoxin system
MWTHEIAKQLRTQSHDAQAVTETAALRKLSDIDIFAFAQEELRAIVTENTPDFRRLVIDAQRRGQSHAVLIYTVSRDVSRHDPRVVGRMVTLLTEIMTTHQDLADRELWI